MIGAGVAGCALAARLRRLGWRGPIGLWESGRGAGGACQHPPLPPQPSGAFRSRSATALDQRRSCANTAGSSA
ncbi:MAG: NAD(P)-binding protein [Prochlorococcaceae cyanobacterium]